MIIEVEKLRFEFEAGWQACAWDDCKEYRHGLGKLDGSKAVDIVARRTRPDILYLIEVKDFRGARKANKQRITEHELASEVATKTRDTLAGLLGAHRAAPVAWKPFIELLEAGDVRVVLWLEEDPLPPPETLQAKRRKAARANLQQMLKRKLAWLHAHPTLASKDNGLPEIQVTDLIP